MRLLFFSIAFIFAPVAVAQLYVCKDGSGERGSITSAPVQGRQCDLQKSHERVNRPPAAASASAAASSSSSSPSSSANNLGTVRAARAAVQIANNPAPANYPVVSYSLQKLRDKKRGRVLLYELERETRRHRATSSQLALERNKSSPNRRVVAYMQKQVAIHAQNITAIQQELDRLD